MELMDFLVHIERYISHNGLTYSDSIEALLDSINDNIKENE